MMTSDSDPKNPAGMGHAWDQPSDPVERIRTLWLPKEYDDGWPMSYQAWAQNFDRHIVILRNTSQGIEGKTPFVEEVLQVALSLWAALHRMACSYLRTQGCQGLVDYMNSVMCTVDGASQAEHLGRSWKAADWPRFRKEVGEILGEIGASVTRLDHVPQLTMIRHDILAMTTSGDESVSEAARDGRISGHDLGKKRGRVSRPERQKQLVAVISMMMAGTSMSEACRQVGIPISTFRDNAHANHPFDVALNDALSRRRAPMRPKPPRDDDEDTEVE